MLSVALQLPELRQRLEPVHAGHHGVQQDQIRGRGRVLFEEIEHRLTGFQRGHADAAPAQHTVCDFQIRRFVVDDQDPFHDACLLYASCFRPTERGTEAALKTRVVISDEKAFVNNILS